MVCRFLILIFSLIALYMPFRLEAETLSQSPQISFSTKKPVLTYESKNRTRLRRLPRRCVIFLGVIGGFYSGYRALDNQVQEMGGRVVLDDMWSDYLERDTAVRYQRYKNALADTQHLKRQERAIRN